MSYKSVGKFIYKTKFSVHSKFLAPSKTQSSCLSDETFENEMSKL